MDRAIRKNTRMVLRGDADKSADAVERSAGDQPDLPAQESGTGGGQHIHVALLSAAAGAGRGHGGALDHKVSEWAQRWAGRRGGVQQAGAGREAGVFAKGAGAILSPFECWLVLRGVKTLAARMEIHDRNGRVVAEFLAKHKKVSRGFLSGADRSSAA